MQARRLGRRAGRRQSPVGLAWEDDKGVKQPLWHTHHEFYDKSRRYVSDFRKKEGRLPTSEEFRRFALGILDADPKQAD